MLKRLATLLLGIALIGLGVLLFIAPGGSVIIQWLTKLWPIFLILAGLVRTFGYLIDRHPRSPVGGMLIVAVGGILLAANLRGERSFLQIFGQYWFFLLMALIIGRVLWQYTHRIEDGKRPRAFSIGAIFLMVLLAGGGLASNYLSKNRQYLNGVEIKLSRLGFLGHDFTVENTTPATLTLTPESRLLVGNFNGDVLVSGSSDAVPTARLIKRIRANNQEEANQIAQHIKLQIAESGRNLQFSVMADDVQHDYSSTLMIQLPTKSSTGIEANGVNGKIKLTALHGDHLLRDISRVEIADNIGKVKIERLRDSAELTRIQGEVNLTDARGNVTFQEVSGAINLDVRGGNVTIEQSSGPVQARLTDTRLTVNKLAANASMPGGAQPVLKLSEAANSRISLQEIKGSIIINASRTHIEAEDIIGDLTINNTSERVQIRRINGALKINSENSVLAIEEVNGSTEIEATKNDVTIRGFTGPVNVTTTSGAINLITEEKLAGNIKAISERGRIRVSIPEDSSFKFDAQTERGRLRVSGFEDIKLSNRQRQINWDHNFTSSSPTVGLRSSRGDVELQSSGLALASRAE